MPSGHSLARDSAVYGVAGSPAFWEVHFSFPGRETQERRCAAVLLGWQGGAVGQALLIVYCCGLSPGPGLLAAEGQMWGRDLPLRTLHSQGDRFTG